MDTTEARWRRRPILAAAIRAVVITAPLIAAIAAGVAASRLFRPVGWAQTAGWVVWTGAVSIGVLAVVDAAARRLLPLQRLLQLCLVFPDRAPSRLRVAVRAARPRRPELFAADGATGHASAAGDAAGDAAAAAGEIVELLAALAVHDRRTRGHSERVCAYTELLAAQMDLPAPDRDRLMWVSLIHDIGKLRVPSRLLNKPGQPTVPEWQVLQAHPLHGDHIVAPLRGWLGPWADAVVQHHERYDGAGYPRGLRGDQLCLGARIIAVTDAFEVMTAPRPYRRPVDPQSARAELARHAGGQFDPHVVRQFLAVGLPQLRRSMGLFAWLGQIPFIRSWPQLQSAPAAAATQAATVTAAASSAGALLLAPAMPMPADAAVAQTSGSAVTHATVVVPMSGAQSTALATPHARPHHHQVANVAASPAATARAAASGDTSRGGHVIDATAAPAPASTAASAGTTPATGTEPAKPAPSASACASSHSSQSSHGRHRGWTRGRGNRDGRAHDHTC